MILQETIDKVEKIGGGESHQFSIHVSRKAFQILSDLYSDKPLAIVRELGCNAVDSHAMSGKSDLPIAIHLPNSLEPYLEIRDFGTGISREDIFKIYSSYFTSTKTTSNDAIGCLGLGSKSPFCYTDNFSVCSRHNGTKTLYLAYFDESGAPTLTIGSEEPDSEGNGVSIQIPVKKEDCNKFIDATKTAFKWFKVKPTITGAAIDWAAIQGEVAIEGNGWSVLKKMPNSGYYNSQVAFAVMGGVNYPIDINKVNGDVRAVCHNLIVEFPIGQLDFAPSREALSYDTRTIENLNKRLAVVKSEISAKAKVELDTAPYLDQAAKVWQSLPEFVRRAMGDFTWKGNKFPSIKFPFTAVKKLSYRKTLLMSRRDYVSLEEIGNASGISFTLDKVSSSWKVKQWVFDQSGAGQSGSAMAYLFPDDTKKELVRLGVNPAIFTCSSTLAYVRTKNAGVARQIDKEVVFQAGDSYGRYGRFTSVNLREAINNGAKYYAVKENTNASAYIKGRNIDYQRVLYILGKDTKSCVFVAATKEKLAVAAGLIHLDAYVDAQVAKVQNCPKFAKSLAFDDMNSVLAVQHSVAYQAQYDALFAAAKAGTSNLAKALCMSLEKQNLEKEFNSIKSTIKILGLSSNFKASTAIAPITLSPLEGKLQEQLCSRYDLASWLPAYLSYEEMVKNCSKNAQKSLT